MDHTEAPSPSWLSSNLSYDKHYNVAQLQSFLKELDVLVRSTKDRLAQLEAHSKKIQKALLAKVDAGPLEVSTPQSNFYATPEGRERLLGMSRAELQEYFFDCNSGVSESQKREVYCYCRRFFPSLSSSVIERALQANRNHLAGAHLMLEAWRAAGAPERFTWKPLHAAATEGRFRMAWAFEDFRQRADLKKKESSEDLLKPLSTPMLLELQFVHVRREWQKLRRPPAQRPPLPALGRLSPKPKPKLGAGARRLSESDLSNGAPEAEKPRYLQLTRRKSSTGGSGGNTVSKLLSQVRDLKSHDAAPGSSTCSTSSSSRIPIVKPRLTLQPLKMVRSRYLNPNNKMERSTTSSEFSSQRETTMVKKRKQKSASSLSTTSSESSGSSETTKSVDEENVAHKIARGVVEDILSDII